MRKTAVLALLMTEAVVAFAQYEEAYKCVSNGSVTFSDKPCSTGRQTVIRTEPAVKGSRVTESSSSIVREQKAAFYQALRAGDSKRAYLLAVTPHEKALASGAIEHRRDEERTQAAQVEAAARQAQQEQARQEQARRNAAIAAEEAKKQERLERARQQALLLDAQPKVLTNCDSSGCWDDKGGRYDRSGSQLIGPRGVCQQMGNMVQCP